MRIVIIILILVFSVIPSYAIEYSCPDENLFISKNENFLNRISGINLSYKKIIEMIIEKELGEELNSSINANLKIYSLKGIQNGEFKSLNLKSKQINYRGFSISDVNADTICKYNKILNKKSKIYYPYDLPFIYTAKITNEDIMNALSSTTFNQALENNPILINKKALIKIYNPKIEIKNNKLYFIIPIKTKIGSIKLNFSSDIAVENNVIMLTNIMPENSYGILNNIFITLLADIINPLKYELDTINSKYCKIYITNAKIFDNIINVEGIFIIKKNYTGD